MEAFGSAIGSTRSPSGSTVVDRDRGVPADLLAAEALMDQARGA